MEDEWGWRVKRARVIPTLRTACSQSRRPIFGLVPRFEVPAKFVDHLPELGMHRKQHICNAVPVAEGGGVLDELALLSNRNIRREVKQDTPDSVDRQGEGGSANEAGPHPEQREAQKREGERDRAALHAYDNEVKQ